MPVTEQRVRRREERIALDVHVHVRGPDGHDVVLMSVDWSSRSVFLRSREPFALGTPVDMFALVGNPLRRVTLAGIVRRIVPHVPESVHAREGMVVVFDKARPDLNEGLDEIIKSRMMIDGAVEVGLSLPVLVVGAEATAQTVARVLRLAGYDVTRAENAARATDAIAAGLDPRAVILTAGRGPMRWPPAPSRPSASLPDVIVALGTLPRDLVTDVNVPVVMLPKTWPAERLPEVLKGFLGEPKEKLEVLQTADMLPASWFQIRPRISGQVSIRVRARRSVTSSSDEPRARSPRQQREGGATPPTRSEAVRPSAENPALPGSREEDAMKRVITRMVPACLVAVVTACATPSVYSDRLAKSEASCRGAQEAGADDVPFARLHLKMAQDETDAAKKLEADGRDEEASRMLENARADAELAIGLAQQSHAEGLAQQAQAQVDALQHANSNAP
jgi:hypothetical protein